MCIRFLSRATTQTTHPLWQCVLSNDTLEISKKSGMHPLSVKYGSSLHYALSVLAIPTPNLLLLVVLLRAVVIVRAMRHGPTRAALHREQQPNCAPNTTKQVLKVLQIRVKVITTNPKNMKRTGPLAFTPSRVHRTRQLECHQLSFT